MVGLAQDIVNVIDWEASIASVLLDIRSDFILSPHFDAVFQRNSKSLIESAKSDLRSGRYNPRPPITMSVPKSNFLTRPGSILEPKDRLIHQAIVQYSITQIEEQLDRTRTFSHIPSQDEEFLFEQSNIGWKRFQNAVSHICEENAYIIKTDIANYFETIPQHVVINLLSASGVPPEIVRLLEEQLLSFRGRSSTGILQGIYPSDVLGNFYLSDFDSDCDLKELPSARYVDDIFIGHSDEISARREIVNLSSRLRQNGLALNPAKTKVVSSAEIVSEERELDRMFSEARDEVESNILNIIEGGYGFQGDWINNPEANDGINVELHAVNLLMQFENVTDQQREKIERFCLPILRGANDNSSVPIVLRNLNVRPQLTRLYAGYLSHFAESENIIRRHVSTLINQDDFFCDYQRMYMVAILLGCTNVPNECIRSSLRWLNSNSIGHETRALCAIFCAKFGSAAEKRAVRIRYDNEPSEYVKAAILYSAQYFPTAEKRAAKGAWRGHSEINSFINEII